MGVAAFGGLLFVLFGLCVLSGSESKNRERSASTRNGLRVMKWATAGLLVCTLLSPFVLEYAKNTIVVFNDKGEIEYTSDFIVPCVTDCLDVSFSTGGRGGNFLTVSSSVQVLTENPKVRELSYDLATFISSPRKFFESERECLLKNYKYNADHGTRVAECLRARMEFYLYEFNNAHSRELAEFYNPRDPEQVQRLDWLLQRNVAPSLVDHGIEFGTLSAFSIR